jgi:hypothetical protein
MVLNKSSLDPGSSQIEVQDIHQPNRNEEQVNEIRMKKKEMTFPGPGINNK